MHAPHLRRLVALGMLAFGLATAAPAFAADYSYWVVHPQEKVYPTTSVPAAHGTSTNPAVGIALGAAKAEFEGRQLVIRPSGAGLRDVWLQPSDLVQTDGSGGTVATIPASQVSAYKIGYVKPRRPSTGLKGTAAQPDPLLPMTLANGQRLGWQVGGGMDVGKRAVALGLDQPFYVLFHVPAAAVAGTYRGTVAITCTGTDGVPLPELRVPVTLTVYPFSVARKSLKTLFELNVKWAGYASSPSGFLGKDTDVDGEGRVYEGTTFKADQYRGWFQYMSDHRIGPATMLTAWENGSDWMPPDDAGNMVARPDYLKDYLGTGAATTFAGERFGFSAVKIPDTGVKAIFRDPFSSTARTDYVAKYLSTMARQLGSYVSRAYVYPIDEPSGGRALIEKYAAFAHRHAPGAKFLLTTAGNTWDYKPLKGVDTYVQRLHFYYRDYDPWIKPLRRAGKEIWMYSHATPWQTKTPAFMIDGPITDPRAQGWFAYDTDVSGVLYYSINRWQTASGAYRDAYVDTESQQNGGDCYSNGDGSLVYPGYYPALGMPVQGSPPVGSLRMESLRDGFEDHEYLSVLEDGAGRAVGDYYVSQVVGAPPAPRAGQLTFPSYPRRASSYEAARRQITHRLAATTAYESIAGANRYQTAAKASRSGFTTATCVVVATGANWPDALGGAALAAAEGGPILLTPRAALPAEVVAEIRRLKASRAVILGGGAAVSSNVQAQLGRLLGSGNVRRIGGANRYQTAELIARAAVARAGGSYDGKAFVATGANFPDALAASPLSSARVWPILLSAPKAGVLPSTAATMRAIGVSEVFVLGSGSAVPDSVRQTLARSYAVTRLGGRDRYATAAAIAKAGVARAGLSYDGLALATGADFPDALAGGVLQGHSGSVLLLTPRASLASAVTAIAAGARADIHRVRFLGATGALGVAPREQLRQTLN